MMPNPWLILGSLLATLALMAATAAYTHHIDALALHAYQTKEAAIAEKAAAQSEAQARAVEAQVELQQTSIVQSYREQLHALSQTHDAAVRAFRNADRLRRDHAGTGSDGVSEAATCTARVDAAREGGLSSEDAQFLVGEAERADRLAAKVAALQRVVEGDRR
jgi:hypothetical protein